MQVALATQLGVQHDKQLANGSHERHFLGLASFDTGILGTCGCRGSSAPQSGWPITLRVRTRSDAVSEPGDDPDRGLPSRPRRAVRSVVRRTRSCPTTSAGEDPAGHGPCRDAVQARWSDVPRKRPFVLQIPWPELIDL